MAALSDLGRMASLEGGTLLGVCLGCGNRRGSVLGSVRVALLMCNDYERYIAWDEYCKAMQALEWGIPTDQTETDLPQAADTRIRDIAPVIRAAGNGVELTPMRWSFPPPRPKGKPVFNFRSEGRRFKDSKRCLVPASAFFEFTGTRPRRRSIGSRSLISPSCASRVSGETVLTVSRRTSRC